jgi:hypothetical protein
MPWAVRFWAEEQSAHFSGESARNGGRAGSITIDSSSQTEFR